MSTPRRLEGQVALVTGAARGLGRAIALRLAAEGAAVAALDLLPHEATDGLLPLVADVSDRDQVERAVAEAQERLGPVTVAVNNAGVCPTAGFLDVEEKDWDTALRTNLLGTFHVGQCVARGMAERGAGSIVNVSSISAQRASSQQTAYASSKAAVEALSRAMSYELGPLGIRVNCVAPGTFLTPLTVDVIPVADREARIQRIPLGRTGEPEELAAAVAFLASGDASFVQGVVLHVDGGYVTGGMRDSLREG